MKKTLKMIGLVIVGLLTAVIIYPFLHEVGHSLVALLVGAKITDFNLLPMPFIECEVSSVDITGQIFIGLGGMVFPFVVSMIYTPKKFWGWYVSLLLKGISVYSVVLSIMAIVFHINGYSWQNEDVVQVLYMFPNGKWLLIIALCLAGTYGLVRLFKEKFFSRCVGYFAKI